MIDFSFSEDEELFGRTADIFAMRELRPRQREHEQARAVDPAVAGGFEQAGFDAIGLPGEISALSRCLILEKLAFGDAGAAVALLSAPLTRMASHEAGISDAHAETARFVHVAESVTLTPQWLPLRPPAAVLLFDIGGAWRIVELGGSLVASLGLLAAGGARPSVEATLAEGQSTPDAAARALASLHLAAGALLLGVARASLEHAREYVQEREAFGKTLAQHQGLAFIVADMAIRTEAARLLLHATALGTASAAGKAPAISAPAAAGAYLECAEAALFTTERAVQLLGGHGYMKAHPVEKWMRDARALALLWGGEDLAAQVAAGSVALGGSRGAHA